MSKNDTIQFEIDRHLTMPKTGQFVTTKEAARRLGTSLRTAQLWVENGKLDAWKTDGGHRRISVASIERLQRRSGSDAPSADLPVRTTRDDARADRLQILVVEDDDLLLRLYKRVMTGWQLPIDIECASDGYDALLRIGRRSPDLMISDLRMPRMDGFQLIRSLVTSPFREGMRIVVITSLGADAIAAEGGLPSGIPVLAKPPSMAALRSIVAEMLDRTMTLGAIA